MKSMKERMDILEQQFINLRDSLLSDLKKHFAVDNGNLRISRPGSQPLFTSLWPESW